MKKLCLFSLTIIFVLVSTVTYAAERAPLGMGNLAVKLDYLNFTDDLVDDFDVDDAFYVGLEGYGEIAPNLYIGAEVGYANPDGDILGIDTEITFVPIEVNLKYAIKPDPNLVIDFGAGVSYNYVDEDLSYRSESVSEDDWLFGGQFFVDLNYKFSKFFIGLNAKYQITEEFEEWSLDIADHNLNNWRVGGQIGIMF